MRDASEGVAFPAPSFVGEEISLPLAFDEFVVLIGVVGAAGLAVLRRCLLAWLTENPCLRFGPVVASPFPS